VQDRRSDPFEKCEDEEKKTINRWFVEGSEGRNQASDKGGTKPLVSSKQAANDPPEKNVRCGDNREKHDGKRRSSTKSRKEKLKRKKTIAPTTIRKINGTGTLRERGRGRTRETEFLTPIRERVIRSNNKFGFTLWVQGKGEGAQSEKGGFWGRQTGLTKSETRNPIARGGEWQNDLRSEGKIQQNVRGCLLTAVSYLRGAGGV